MICGYVSNGTTQDGFGSRLHKMITTMAFTFYLQDKFNANIEYIHTPFSFEGFENFDIPEMVKLREIGDGEEPYNEVNHDGYLKRAILWDNKINYSGIKITDINFNDFEIIGNINWDDGYNALLIDISMKQTDNKIYIIRLGLSREFDKGIQEINMIDIYYSKLKEKFQ